MPQRDLGFSYMWMFEPETKRYGDHYWASSNGKYMTLRVVKKDLRLIEDM